MLRSTRASATRRRFRVSLTVSALCAACLLSSACPASAGQDAAEKNLVENPSFERQAKNSVLPEGWWGPPQVYSTDKTVKRTGESSLKYVNADSGRYALCSQRVPVRPSWKCRFSVWVKTQDVVGDESGATICLEWQDKQGKWLGGSYPPGISGTHDWTRIEGVTRVPKEAATCSLLCYVRKGMTGTAWFDDVELIRIADPPMRTVLLSPVYRGRVCGTGPEQARVRVDFDLTDYDVTLSQLRVNARLRSRAENQIVWQTSIQPNKDQHDLSFSTQSWKVGHYDLDIDLVGPDRKTLHTTHHRLARLPDDFRPKATIDEHRRLLVDGKPFFPLGMYWSSITEEDVKLYADSKFNCLMPYGSPNQQQMDLTHQHGLKVIYSIKDWYADSRYCPKTICNKDDEERAVRARVRQYRDHPALLAWYLNDELPQSFMPQLKAHQRWVEEEDPHHPTWVVLYQYREVAAYLDTFDVIGTDPYPIGRAPASWAADWTAETLRQVSGARPLWQVPQAHNWANYWKTEAEKKKGRTPSFDEERSMAWQCICEGATGLVFYSWFDIKRNPDVPFQVQWGNLKRIAAEIDQWAPILLSTELAPAVQVRYDSPASEEAGWLHPLVRSHDGKLYLVAANDGDGQGTVTFTFPSSLRSIRVPAENRSVPPDGSRFQDEFQKLTVRIYEIER